MVFNTVKVKCEVGNSNQILHGNWLLAKQIWIKEFWGCSWFQLNTNWERHLVGKHCHWLYKQSCYMQHCSGSEKKTSKEWNEMCPAWGFRLQKRCLTGWRQAKCKSTKNEERSKKLPWHGPWLWQSVSAVLVHVTELPMLLLTVSYSKSCI